MGDSRFIKIFCEYCHATYIFTIDPPETEVEIQYCPRCSNSPDNLKVLEDTALEGVKTYIGMLASELYPVKTTTNKPNRA